MDLLRNALARTLDLYLDTALFLLAGCLLGGLVYAFFPGRIIERWLGGRGLRTLIGAALVGTPLPLCSCGVVPAAVTLRRRGASTGATVAFVVATPETGPDSILVSFALLSPLFAIYRPLAAIVTAVVAGLFAAAGERSKALPTAVSSRLCEICALPDEGEHSHGFAPRLRRTITYAFGDLLEDIGPWLVVGLLLAGIVATFVRPDFVHAHLSSPLAQMLVALVAGIPLYVCASASTPLAAAMVAAGFSPGAALVLMLTGPATNVASLLVLRRELGGAVVALMLLGIALSSLALGALLNLLAATTGFAHLASAGPTGEALPSWLRVAGAVALVGAFVFAYARKLTGRGRDQTCATCRIAELKGETAPAHAHDAHGHADHEHADAHARR